MGNPRLVALFSGVRNMGNPRLVALFSGDRNMGNPRLVALFSGGRNMGNILAACFVFQVDTTWAAINCLLCF